MTNPRGKGGKAGSFSQYATRAARKAADDAANKSTEKAKALIAMSKGKNAEKKTANHTLHKGKDSVTIAGEDDSESVKEDAMVKGLKKTESSSVGPRKLDIAKGQDLGEEPSHHALEDGKELSTTKNNGEAENANAEGEGMDPSSAPTWEETLGKKDSTHALVDISEGFDTKKNATQHALEGGLKLNSPTSHDLVGGTEYEASTKSTDDMAAVAVAAGDHLGEGKTSYKQPNVELGVTMATSQDDLPQ